MLVKDLMKQLALYPPNAKLIMWDSVLGDIRVNGFNLEQRELVQLSTKTCKEVHSFRSDEPISRATLLRMRRPSLDWHMFERDDWATFNRMPAVVLIPKEEGQTCYGRDTAIDY